MPKGYMGKILRVDLTQGKIDFHDLDGGFARQFLGGRGFGVKILWDELPEKTDPFDPKNILVFSTGPLTATMFPCSGRHNISTKSPATGGVVDSTSGGRFAVSMKGSGVDAIIIKGKAEKLSYLYICDGVAEIKDASGLVGKDVFTVEDALKQETDKKAEVAQIGPAGEKLSYMAAVMNNKYRAAGRTGTGAVMGSKNLRAVVCLGNKRPPLADEQKFDEAQKKARELLAQSPVTQKGGLLNALGTDGVTNIINEAGLYPTKNYQFGVFEGAKNLAGETLKEKYLTRNTACAFCPIACGRWSEVKTGPFAVAGEGPEYETVWAFGGHCGNDNLESVIMANYICNKYGLDTISTGNTVGMAIELYERGIITDKDTGGLKLKFGDPEAIVKMTELIAKREGIGDIFADGTRMAGKRIGKGAEYYAMQVKGLELPAYDPRGAFGHGLAYATSNRGACHLRAYVIATEIFGIPKKMDPHDYSRGKVDTVKFIQDLVAAVDSSLVCLFVTFAFAAEPFAEAIPHCTGWTDYTADEFVRTGDRIWTLERAFNAREGFTQYDDTLPKRLLEEPMPEGPNKGKVVPLSQMIGEYYVARGLDSEGKPTEEKMVSLGLS